MRQIAGPGNVAGTFKDYDPITNPSGTQITADWCNDVQNEILGIQEGMGIPESDGSLKYNLAAVKGIAIKFGKPLGELFFSELYRSPSEFDKDSPEDYFPAICLSELEDPLDIDETNWPDLVPELRNKPAYYMHNKTGEKYQFEVINWEISSSIATLTFASNVAELTMIGALAEDQAAHGSYSNWQSITLPSAIGSIPAGDYAITDVDPVSMTVSFIYAGSDGSGSVSSVATFYRHRVAGDTTKARLFPVDGFALMSEGSDRISGFRKLDQMQLIEGYLSVRDGERGLVSDDSAVSGAFYRDTTQLAGEVRSNESGTNRHAVGFNSSLSPNARTSSTTDGETRPRNLAGYLYIWGRTYLA